MQSRVDSCCEPWKIPGQDKLHTILLSVIRKVWFRSIIQVLLRTKNPVDFSVSLSTAFRPTASAVL